jgi:hypothetical protein
VIAFAFYDSNNNHALTLSTVEISSFDLSIYFRGSHVIQGASGPFDFGSYFDWYAKPNVQAIMRHSISILFLNPENGGRPTVQFFTVTDSFAFVPTSPLMCLSNGDFTLSGNLPLRTSGTVTLDLVPVSNTSVVGVYSGTLASLHHKRVALLENFGAPIGVGSGHNEIILNGVAAMSGNFVVGKQYYATTRGDMVLPTVMDPGANFVYVGNRTIVSKDSLIGFAVTSSSIYISN